MNTRHSLIESLQQYRTASQEEQLFIPRFLSLLEHPRAFFRDHLPGHITASAWIVDETRQHVLLTHHAKLNKWLQPGGHADGEEDAPGVARREAIEETGLTSLRVVSHALFDIDIHGIPARPDFPAHDHYDVRFIFQADSEEIFTVTNESHALAWVSKDELAVRTGYNVSMLRMAEKAQMR